MLVLLPPSEGKTAPVRGRRLDLATLSSPALTGQRRLVLDALVQHCRSDPEGARATLGLSEALTGDVLRNAALLTAPTARAERVYTGVLYAALDLGGLNAAARRRAAASVLVTSGLFGLVRPGDRIPAYRLPGDARLPGVGPVAAGWRGVLADEVPLLAGGGPVLDLRSTAYAGFWRPTGVLTRRTVRLRVLHEAGGVRRSVSHFNKATKGRLVRSLLESGPAPRTARGLLDRLRDLGWRLEARTDTDVDVLVAEL